MRQGPVYTSGDEYFHIIHLALSQAHMDVSAKFKAPAAYLMQIFVDPQYALPLTELAAEQVHIAVLGKATTQICQFYRWLHV